MAKTLFRTVAQWLERRSYKSVAEGSIPSSPTFFRRYNMQDEHSDPHEWSFLAERIHNIDIEIESAEHAITHAMAQTEQEDLIKSVIKLQQRRKKLLDKKYKY